VGLPLATRGGLKRLFQSSDVALKVVDADARIARDPEWLSISSTRAGCGFASIYPLVAERIGSEFPDDRPGFFNGIFSLALAGGMLAPGMLAYLADIFGVGIVMLIPVLGTCMVFVLVLLIWLEAKLRLG
jgi:MFS family permease